MTRRIGCAVLLAFTLSVQDVDRARALLQQALDALKPTPPITSVTPPVVSVVTPPIVSIPAPIATPAALDAALATAAPGSVLTLSPDLIYPTPLTIKQSVTLQSDVPLARMDRDRALPKLTAGLTITGDDVTLIGIDVRHTNPLTDIVVIKSARVTLDRVRVLGDPAKGAKRGIAANGNGDVKILRSYVDDCFATYPGSDSQAIFAADMFPGLVIEDNYLSAGSETILLGGMDSSSAERMPSDVTIRGNTITKNPAWQALAIGVKNTLEIKAGRRVTIEKNDISQSWGGHGQDGYAVMLTVRNQDGRAPWSTIEDVEIANNTVHHAAAAINVLGRDNNHPSGTLTRVTIHDNTFTDLDPVKYAGSRRLILIDGGPDALSLTHNTFAGVNFTSAVYFTGKTLAITNLAIVDNTFPKTTYRIFGGNVSAPNTAARFDPVLNSAWKFYVGSGTLSGNTETP